MSSSAGIQLSIVFYKISVLGSWEGKIKGKNPSIHQYTRYESEIHDIIKTNVLCIKVQTATALRNSGNVSLVSVSRLRFTLDQLVESFLIKLGGAGVDKEDYDEKEFVEACTLYLEKEPAIQQYIDNHSK